MNKLPQFLIVFLLILNLYLLYMVKSLTNWKSYTQSLLLGKYSLDKYKKTEIFCLL